MTSEGGTGGRHDGITGVLPRPEMDQKGPRREIHGSIQPRARPQRYLGLMLPSFTAGFAGPHPSRQHPRGDQSRSSVRVVLGHGRSASRCSASRRIIISSLSRGRALDLLDRMVKEVLGSAFPRGPVEFPRARSRHIFAPRPTGRRPLLYTHYHLAAPPGT